MSCNLTQVSFLRRLLSMRSSYVLLRIFANTDYCF